MQKIEGNYSNKANRYYNNINQHLVKDNRKLSNMLTLILFHLLPETEDYIKWMASKNLLLIMDPVLRIIF